MGVWLGDLQKELKWPGKKAPLSRVAVRKLLDKLNIEPTYRRSESGQGECAYIKADQAARVKKEFERIHWKHFKKAA